MTSIIIVSWNTLDYTRLCLESIRQHTDGEYELIVVDNASADGSREWLSQQEDVRLVANEQNLGFPAACNQGLALARGQELLLLNSDTIVTQNWLGNLLEALRSRPKAGAAGCVTNSCSNWQQIDVPYGDDLEAMQEFARGYNRSDPEKWEPRPKLVGFCFLFRRELYDRLGGLDEGFSPGNFEDDDLSVRILEAGYELLLCKDTFIHHFGSASFKKKEKLGGAEESVPGYSSLMERNMQRFFEKWQLPVSYIQQKPGEVREAILRQRTREALWQRDGEALARRVAIVVPAYKQALDKAERISLQQLRRVLKPFRKIFMAPEGLEFSYGELGEGFETLRFPAEYFRSVGGYSRLLLRPEFYESFRDYEYILIHQLDAFVFEDELLKFCELGYDYIGAPVPKFDFSWHLAAARVGNGGFSLRKVSSCVRLLREQHALLESHPYRSVFLESEDAFFGYAGARPDIDFRVPPVGLARTFAVQDDIQHALRRNAPFGVHGWPKFHAGFWCNVISQAFGYDTEGISGTESDFRVDTILSFLRARPLLDVCRLFGAIKAGRPEQASAMLEALQDRPGALAAHADYLLVKFVEAWLLVRIAGTGGEDWELLSQALLGSIQLLLAHGGGAPLGWGMHVLTRVLPDLASGTSERERALGTYIAAIREKGYWPGRCSYGEWLQRFYSLNGQDAEEIRRDMEAFTRRPLISVLMPVYNTRERYLRQALDSVRRQFYPYWELCIADDASTEPQVRRVLEEYRRLDKRIKVTYRSRNGHISAASNTALQLARGEYVALMDHDDLLQPEALYLVVKEVNAAGGNVDLIYTDEDKVDGENRPFEPHFKPDWDGELLYGQNFVNHLGVYRRALLRRLGGFRQGLDGSQDYDLLLRFSRCTRAGRIRHIPRILYHWRNFSGASNFSRKSSGECEAALLKALRDFLPRDKGAVARPAKGCPDYNRVLWPLPARLPLVSIVIPTRDKPELLRACVDSLRAHTSYANYELLVVDNQSTLPSALAYLRELAGQEGVSVLSYDRPFNHSAMCNMAAERARGELLLFLNNDIEFFQADWLTEMVSSLQGERVGIAGAKLLYADGTVQHGGITIGMVGVAGQQLLHWPGKARGPFGYLALVREVSAVTGACLLVRASVFRAVQGFDERQFPVSFNDVDFCLRARAAGWRAIFNPEAVAVHRESASRGYADTAAKQAAEYRDRRRMYERYGAALQQDPFYNSNLSRLYPSMETDRWHSAGKPWRPWAELVCPSLADALLGFQVAQAAQAQGQALRLHVSRAAWAWLADFPADFPVLPLDGLYGTGDGAEQDLARAYYEVAARPDFSGRLLGSHAGTAPLEAARQLGLNKAEYWQQALGLPLGSPLPGVKPAAVELPADIAALLGRETALVCASGPEGALPGALRERLFAVLRAAGWRILQIGLAGEERLEGCDGCLLSDEPAGWWRSVFEQAGLCVCVDSWASHFARILGLPQIAFFGRTRAREAFCSASFGGKRPQELVFETKADCAPCYHEACPFSEQGCRGYALDEQALGDFLRRL